MSALVESEVMSQRRLYGQTDKNIDWVFLAPLYWDEGMAGLMRQYLKNGAGVFLAPGKSAQAYSEAVKNLLGTETAVSILGGDEEAGIANAAFSGELRKYGARAYVKKYFPLRVGKALISYDNGAFFAGRRGDVYYFSAPLTEDNGNIVLHPGLAVWFINWLSGHSRSDAFTDNFFCGGDTVVELKSEWNKFSRALLAAPSGRFEVEINGGRLKLRKKILRKPGNYLLSADGLKYFFSVNVNPLEYREFRYIPDEKLLLNYGGGFMQPLLLWKYFIFFALLTLIAEMLIRYRYRGFGG
jgi:YHS domain-containing protein